MAKHNARAAAPSATSWRGHGSMSSEIVRQNVETLQSALKSGPSAIEFEMAWPRVWSRGANCQTKSWCIAGGIAENT